MDTIYLRYLQSSDDPAIWGPVDPCSPVTLRQYHKKRSQAEVRFVRGKIRFLLVSTHHSGVPCERVFDLDSSEQRRRLVEVLVQGSFDTKISASPSASATPSGGSKSQSLPDGTAFETIIPRTCFVLKQPSLYESFHPMHPSVNDLSFIV
ncbi:hypothetical protein M407DRAFT_180785 [Tulasnella calospora MUT 4182]|uniref:Uncharacterized protein n=1 Tax=Tulasnella calospora MUT 4182 TaxID=1051891 RepID=A0A0C3L5V6_9AGAM|nr:hypothetical protein M407DRAFT_180785 [Tulasnella calospora MUT 4182]